MWNVEPNILRETIETKKKRILSARRVLGKAGSLMGEYVHAAIKLFLPYGREHGFRVSLKDGNSDDVEMKDGRGGELELGTNVHILGQ